MAGRTPEARFCSTGSEEEQNMRLSAVGKTSFILRRIAGKPYCCVICQGRHRPDVPAKQMPEVSVNVECLSGIFYYLDVSCNQGRFTLCYGVKKFLEKKKKQRVIYISPP